MIQIQQIKLKIPHTDTELKKKICHILRIRPDELQSFRILKRSLDARRKPELFYVYTVEVSIRQENRLRNRLKKNPSVTMRGSLPSYSYQSSGTKTLSHRPVICGTGPAGLFCGYALAKMGYRPILLERGAAVDERVKEVENFWKTGKLLPESNVQFGEGGAGTFSDGKLNTLIHDPDGRGREVLRIFAEHGASPEILYDSKPHIGTDKLIQVVRSIRTAIQSMGGEFSFRTRLTDILTKDTEDGSRIQAAVSQNTLDPAVTEVLNTEVLVLAIGHSARDTFSMLEKRKFPMEAKSFAVGVRIEHPQKMINQSQYGAVDSGLPAASYKLTANFPNGRSVYTFCMCPGGYVVNASSEPGKLAVNGMSYSGRSGKNANSAVIVTVTPDDYPGDGPLAGVSFQQQLEEAAYRLGEGAVPVQLFQDFCADRPSAGPGQITPQIKGSCHWTNVRSIFPEEISKSLEEGIRDFDRKIPGYARPDAVISAVESRTSSPVRILRGPALESSVQGVYPCGEGAGYAGGITSAAMDGLRIARAISQIYRPFSSTDPA
ncbi:FAD-dependent protein [uncultured Merdimonas sp.]|uniref:NAD(P)/FAD-dependent oxidoreductase n=1 Tax=uncultured Merdimonas sp. TaxID=2023269 RepID=UPI0032085DA7